MPIINNGHQPNKNRVCCIVVTFMPVTRLLENLLNTITSQVDQILVVDNGSDVLTTKWLHSRRSIFKLLENGENLGIGAAINRGIIWAQKNCFSHVLLLDQDSVPADNMVKKLTTASFNMQQRFAPLSVFGPKLIDVQTKNEEYFIRFEFPFTKRFYCNDTIDNNYLNSHFLISSGMLIPTSIFKKVGMMDEDFFIDNVDLEWCFRAIQKGVKFYGVCNAEMTHCLSDRILQLWIGKTMTVHWHKAPVRMYYITRNRIRLYLKSYSPVQWILQDFFRMIFKTLFVFIFFPNKKQNIIMFLHGIRDGIRGKMGKYSPSG